MYAVTHENIQTFIIGKLVRVYYVCCIKHFEIPLIL